jgi:hypothetical protein
MIPHQANNVLSSYRTWGFIVVSTKPAICLCPQPHEKSPHPVPLRKFLIDLPFYVYILKLPLSFGTTSWKCLTCFSFSLAGKCSYRDQIKVHGTGRHTRNSYKFWSENLKGWEKLRGLDIERRIILKFILGKYRMRIRSGLNWLEIKSKCGQVWTRQRVP